MFLRRAKLGEAAPSLFVFANSVSSILVSGKRWSGMRKNAAARRARGAAARRRDLPGRECRKLCLRFLEDLKRRTAKIFVYFLSSFSITRRSATTPDHFSAVAPSAECDSPRSVHIIGQGIRRRPAISPFTSSNLMRHYDVAALPKAGVWKLSHIAEGGELTMLLR